MENPISLGGTQLDGVKLRRAKMEKMLLRFAGRRLTPMVRVLRRSAYNGAQRDWQLLASGSRWCEIRKGGEPDSFEVQPGQVVRVEYIAKLDDGTRVVGSTASFKLGNASPAVCTAVQEAVPGMRCEFRRTDSPPPAWRVDAFVFDPSTVLISLTCRRCMLCASQVG